MAAVGALTTSEAGATIDPTGQVGLTVKLVKMWGDWHVIVPDWDAMNDYWVPGMAVPTKLMTVADYLELLDEVYTQDQI
jgi:hypothetical protein